MDNNRLITVNNLSVVYEMQKGEIKAVDNISFHIEKKEILALVGESGSGKSTTAKALMRLVNHPGRISSGNVIFGGEDLLELKEEDMVRIRGKEIGMIFQNPLDSLNPVYKVGNQVAEAIILDNIPRQDAIKKVIDIFNDVKITDAKERINSFPHELSGGMRQRVMIGMMVSRNPKLIIADEPTTALDVTIQAQILELMKSFRDKYDTSILIITHDFGIVAEIADRVGVMYAGEIVEIGDVFTIFENPKHPYTRLLMRALPRITKNEGRLQVIEGSVANLANLPEGCRFSERCPYVMDICIKVNPMLTERESGHFCACHKEDLNNEFLG
ncbi:MAG: ABC transporter ATP-binding protein [Gudongella sp.]|nr:ABC transporter ATP-binding protein [Gudongella sp.]